MSDKNNIENLSIIENIKSSILLFKSNSEVFIKLFIDTFYKLSIISFIFYILAFIVIKITEWTSYFSWVFILLVLPTWIAYSWYSLYLLAKFNIKKFVISDMLFDGTPLIKNQLSNLDKLSDDLMLDYVKYQWYFWIKSSASFIMIILSFTFAMISLCFMLQGISIISFLSFMWFTSLWIFFFILASKISYESMIFPYTYIDNYWKDFNEISLMNADIASSDLFKNYTKSSVNTALLWLWVDVVNLVSKESIITSIADVLPKQLSFGITLVKDFVYGWIISYIESFYMISLYRESALRKSYDIWSNKEFYEKYFN